MKIAIEGCAHGELDAIYATVQHLERAEGVKVDLLICCGDFQAVRNEQDLQQLACPPKYRAMNSFWKYYSGQAVAPYPTLFVGGNHEATNYLWELYYGGWAAPNIYFLGFAGVVRFGGVRIGGLSGIYKKYHYHTGHFETPPYDADAIKSVYHVREFEVESLKCVRQPLDVFLSHDWPRGIARHGATEQLLRRKAFLRQEVESNTLGSPPGEDLLRTLRPAYWFAAHLHTKFAAVVPHAGGCGPTKFLALDKCLPRRNFLQVVSFPDAKGPMELCYDEEWLSIVRARAPHLPLGHGRARLQPALDLGPHAEFVRGRLRERGAAIPKNFAATVAPHDPSAPRRHNAGAPVPVTGVARLPQTEAFCELLEMPWNLDPARPLPPLKGQESVTSRGGASEAAPLDGADDIPWSGPVGNGTEAPDDVDELESSLDIVPVSTDDPNEIALEDDEDGQEAAEDGRS